MTRLSEEEARRADIVARDHQGIYRPYEAFYLHSVHYAAQRSAAAFTAFSAALSDGEPPDAVFAAVQDALGHAAALSRFFWPASQAGALGAARGKRLRDAFALSDRSALSSRALRNAIEHLDERIDRFLLKDPVGYFFPVPLIADQSIADEPIGHVFKLIDPEGSICVILGEKFDFAPIELEVRRLQRLAEEFMSRGAMLPR